MSLDIIATLPVESHAAIQPLRIVFFDTCHDLVSVIIRSKVFLDDTGGSCVYENLLHCDVETGHTEKLLLQDDVVEMGLREP